MRYSLLVFILVAGCVAEEDVGSIRQSLDAYCTATVEGTGLVDVETDYLPHVVNCENGAAAFEALKAQAVAARTYLYYKLDTSGSIADGTNDQVYSCGREPRAEHYEAVEATRGIVLQYTDETIAGFFVAGARQTGPSCMGGTDDPTNTERYVTYNSGRSGADLIQTTLGFVHPDNIYNRGCMSQNGTHCLAEAGWPWRDMMPFYYGEDIELVQTEGPCIDPPDSDAGTPDAGMSDAEGVDVGAPDATMMDDAGGVDTSADEPSVDVMEPPPGARPLTSGCNAGGGVSAWWLLLVARRRKRRQG